MRTGYVPLRISYFWRTFYVQSMLKARISYAQSGLWARETTEGEPKLKRRDLRAGRLRTRRVAFSPRSRVAGVHTLAHARGGRSARRETRRVRRGTCGRVPLRHSPLPLIGGRFDELIVITIALRIVLGDTMPADSDDVVDDSRRLMRVFDVAASGNGLSAAIATVTAQPEQRTSRAAPGCLAAEQPPYRFEAVVQSKPCLT